MPNPFVYNAPVVGNDFFNREEIIQTILKEVLFGKTQGDVWITGERQVGKTSILKHIFNKNNDLEPVKIYGTEKYLKPVFAFANVQYCNSEHEFYNALWQSLKDTLDFKFNKVKNAETNFVNAVKHAYTNDFFIIFLLDEFDAFLETLALKDNSNARQFINSLNYYLKNFPSLNKKVFSCIFTTNQEIKDINDKYNIQITGSGIVAEFLELKWFDYNQVKGLAEFYTINSEIKFLENEIQLVFKYTGGYPYFVQMLLSKMYDYKKTYINKAVDELIVKEFYDNAFEQTIKLWFGQNMPKRTFTKLKNFMTETGKKLFDTSLKVLVEYSKSTFDK